MLTPEENQIHGSLSYGIACLVCFGLDGTTDKLLWVQGIGI